MKNFCFILALCNTVLKRSVVKEKQHNTIRMVQRSDFLLLVIVIETPRDLFQIRVKPRIVVQIKVDLFVSNLFSQYLR